MEAFENSPFFREKTMLLLNALNCSDNSLVSDILCDEKFTTAFVRHESCTRIIQLKLLNAMICCNEAEMLKFFLDQGFDVNVEEELMMEIDEPPLWNAVVADRDHLAGMLIQAGANVNQRRNGPRGIQISQFISFNIIFAIFFRSQAVYNFQFQWYLFLYMRFIVTKSYDEN